MRLPVDAGYRLVALGLTIVMLAGCGLVDGAESPRTALLVQPATTGPAADYPMVLGDAFAIDGETYTPADTLNYDMVGYATIDDGGGVTLASRTLPLPSYVEVTSLATGKTILARVERRGPMSGSNFVALSPAAAEQLGATDGVAIRVRRVNPPEQDRAELRAGRPASERMETPKSLVEVLRRKLPETGAASLRARVPARSTRANADPVAAPVVANAIAASAVRTVSPEQPARDVYMVQAGTFAVRDNAERVAQTIGGFIAPSGKYYRVRTGPFPSREQADAALAKVRAAGYSDARVFTAG